jgi:hypothetical protein
MPLQNKNENRDLVEMKKITIRFEHENRIAIDPDRFFDRDRDRDLKTKTRS